MIIMDFIMSFFMKEIRHFFFDNLKTGFYYHNPNIKIQCSFSIINSYFSTINVLKILTN